MKQFSIFFLLMVFSCTGNAADWKLVSSQDGFWIKTTNNNKHELLLAYKKNQPHFLLILTTDNSAPEKTIPIKIKIDKEGWVQSKLKLLEKRSGKIIFRIEADSKDNLISKMIAGINLFVNFSFENYKNKTIKFSLHGFTAAFNDLLIVNKIGSMKPAWLIKHRKDRELYCLLTTNISILAIEYRLQGKSYAKTLTLIPKSQHSIIDHNFGEIINQIYQLPYKNLPYVPRAEKYLMFSRCMKKPFQ
jgi:hypothetical protein